MKMITLKLIVGCALSFAAAQGAMAHDDDRTPSTAPAADNTKSNKTDPSNMDMTADNQKEDSKDIALTQRIRKRVMADKSLSMYAHNVKIVSINGTVTLNGVVRTDREKKVIEAKAAAVAGHTHVVNDLKVEPKQP